MSFDFFQATELFVSQDLAYFHNDKHRKLLDLASTSQPFKRGKEDPADRTLLVSDLKMHTMKPKIYGHFEYTLKETVERITFNHWDNKKYNMSCLVVMDSVRAARRVRKRPSREHRIDYWLVPVQFFQGKENHPEVFKEGEHEMLVDMLNEIHYPHKLIEDSIYKDGGTYSCIHWRMDEFGEFSGEARIRFYEEHDRVKAYNVIKRNLTPRAYLPIGD